MGKRRIFTPNHHSNGKWDKSSSFSDNVEYNNLGNQVCRDLSRLGTTLKKFPSTTKSVSIFVFILIQRRPCTELGPAAFPDLSP